MERDMTNWLGQEEGNNIKAWIDKPSKTVMDAYNP